jgi:hypothetical protein
MKIWWPLISAQDSSSFDHCAYSKLSLVDTQFWFWRGPLEQSNGGREVKCIFVSIDSAELSAPSYMIWKNSKACSQLLLKLLYLWGMFSRNSAFIWCWMLTVSFWHKKVPHIEISTMWGKLTPMFIIHHAWIRSISCVLSSPSSARSPMRWEKMMYAHWSVDTNLGFCSMSLWKQEQSYIIEFSIPVDRCLIAYNLVEDWIDLL